MRGGLGAVTTRRWYLHAMYTSWTAEMGHVTSSFTSMLINSLVERCLTCSPYVLVILKYWPALNSMALPLPPGTVRRSLTGTKLAGTERSFDDVLGAVIVVAPSTEDGRALQLI